MIVFYNSPYGSTMLYGMRVYGYLEPHPPVQLPWELYKLHRENLVLASYNKPILESLFPGQVFPEISFTYYEMRHLTWEQMCALCKALNITTNRSNESRRRKLRKFFRENC